MTDGALEKLLRFILPYHLFLILTLTICGSFAGYLDHDGYRIGDWLINYSGGFVRRGLFGELVLALTGVTSLNPGLLVAFSQTLFYSSFFVCCYLLLKRTRLSPYALLIFSPFIFTFQINDFQGGYRKEIIFFALLSFLAYAKVAFPVNRFRILFFISLLLYPAAILSHEMLAVFLPYLIALYALNNRVTRKQWMLVALSTLPSVISLILCVQFSGTTAQEEAILSSLSALNYQLTDGAIAWLNYSATDGLRSVQSGTTNSPYASYLFVIGLSAVAFVPIRSGLKNMISDRLVLFFMVCSTLGSVAVAAVALDWGRLIYVNLVALFVLSLATKTETENRFRPKGVTLALLVLWALFFRIPHWGGGNILATNWRQVNFVSYYKPLYRLTSNFESPQRETRE